MIKSKQKGREFNMVFFGYMEMILNIKKTTRLSVFIYLYVCVCGGGWARGSLCHVIKTKHHSFRKIYNTKFIAML